MLSEELNRINNSVIRIRNKLNVNTAPIEEVATAVENYKGETDIYKVTTLEERDALNPKEGDVCLVHVLDEFNYDGTKTSNILVFPEVITVETAVTTSASTYLVYGPDAYDRIQFSLSSTYFRARDYDTYEMWAQYTSTDGITYTRTSTIEEKIFDQDLQPYSTFNNKLTPFIFLKGMNFGGLFQYSSGVWEFLDIGLKIDPSNVFKGTKVYGNEGTVTGLLGSADADPIKTLDAMAKIHSSVSELKFSGILINSLTSVEDQSYKYWLADENKALKLPAIDCSEITQILSSASRYNYTMNFDTQPYYKFNIASCDGFMNLGAGFVDADAAGINVIPQAILQFMDDASIVKVLKNLATVSASKYAGISITRPIYNLIVENNLKDEILNKGWKFYVAGYSKYIEFNDFDGTTISEATSFVSGKSNDRCWFAGTNFPESILTQSITLTMSNVFDTCCCDPLNEYMPIINIKLNNSASYPNFYANSAFCRCTALKRIGGISYSSSHSTYNTLSSASSMFEDCFCLEELPYLNLSTITSASDFAKNCYKITTIPAYNFNKVTSGSGMFYGCKSLTDISNLSLTALQIADNLFYGCESLVNIPSTFKLTNATQIYYALQGCKSLTGTSIYNFLNGTTTGNIASESAGLSLKRVGVTLEQWNTLTSSQQSTILAKGFINDCE